MKVSHANLHRAIASPLKELVIHVKVMTHSRQRQNGANIASVGAARITRLPAIEATCRRLRRVCSLISCRTPRPLMRRTCYKLEGTACVVHFIQLIDLKAFICWLIRS